MHLMSYYGTYHHHKENMAWVATAFFIPTIVSFAFAAGHIANEHYICRIFLHTFIITFIILACAWAMCFVVWQFNKRSVAGQNALNCYKRLRGRCGEQWFIEIDDPPEGYISEVLSCLAIVGATAIAIFIVLTQ